MEKEIKELLEEIRANQVVIYKRIEDLEYKVKQSGFRSASMKSYSDELKNEAEKLLKKTK